jgi:hypothetical protein
MTGIVGEDTSDGARDFRYDECQIGNAWLLDPAVDAGCLKAERRGDAGCLIVLHHVLSVEVYGDVVVRSRVVTDSCLAW